jgi:hypothetical protein
MDVIVDDDERAIAIVASSDKLTLEGFTLTFASPYTQNKWNLDVRQSQEVLGRIHQLHLTCEMGA